MCIYRQCRSLLLLAHSLLFFLYTLHFALNDYAFAGTTGKITGQVTDQDGNLSLGYPKDLFSTDNTSALV